MPGQFSDYTKVFAAQIKGMVEKGRGSIPPAHEDCPHTQEYLSKLTTSQTVTFEERGFGEAARQIVNANLREQLQIRIACEAGQIATQQAAQA